MNGWARARWGQVALLGGAAALYFTLLEVYDSTTSSQSCLDEPADGCLTSRWFSIWAAMAIVSALIWCEVLRIGLRRLRRTPGATSAAAVVCYLAVAAAATWFIRSATSRASFLGDAPVVGAVVFPLLALGWLTAAPWTLLVWHARDKHAGVARAVDDVGPPRWDATGSSVDVDADAVRAATGTLRTAWGTIEASALAFAVVLSTVVLNTGTLRLAALGSGAATDAEAPAVFVLAYGAFFAAVAAALIAPLAVPWRNEAVRLVDRALGEPTTGVPTAEYVATRERFLGHLGLRTGVLRSPITALSVLAPFATAFVTAVVPTG
ncbi:hypothetical protein [Cellulomonas rhizosphaerae]|uniref:Uncharacterized protein n=1 Tax=Cellulomonas rhizosphaerae TaxID=2293719 RepID=A0A413RKM1_9CELL|nr:hypothetical protein [Cellulomonas rhizosphaerae]RHA39795.1 hypothetical protein D1825_11185 [Cellulomonas rhizosphaerae]